MSFDGQCANRPAQVFRQGRGGSAGFQIFQVQEGHDPDDWKPMSSIGPGVREIRIREEDGAFRVIYVAKFADAVYVLHCFQKKTQKTGFDDIALASRRYKDLIRELRP